MTVPLCLTLDYFEPDRMDSLINDKFCELFGRGPREAEGDIEKIHINLARSVQAVTEEAMLRMARHAHKITGHSDLCLSGGVALNCVANGKLLKEGPFGSVWVQPASTDAGCSLGAAFIAWHEYLGKEKKSKRQKKMSRRQAYWARLLQTKK